MNPYGLFKVIDKNKKRLNIELFNLLHPENRLNDIKLHDIEPKTFFNFFYEDNSAILKADIDIQYIEYNKFKKELDQMIYKKTISQYEKDIINKMLQKLIVAENKFIKYQEEILKINDADRENHKIIDKLDKDQSTFAKNIDNYLELYYNYIDLYEDAVPNYLKILFDTEHIDGCDYENTIMYPDSIISYYRTNIVCDNGIITLNDTNRAEYIVFELDPNESIGFITTEANSNTKNKLKQMIELCNEMDIAVPEIVQSKINSISRCVEFKYLDKNLYIRPVEKGEKEIKYIYQKFDMLDIVN